MRFDRKSRAARKRWSVNAHAAKARKRMAAPAPDYPESIEPGTVRHTIRVTDHRQGQSFEIKLKQAPRINQVVVETFGSESKPHGIDWLVRHLRRRLL